jgi:hypothetical protein
MLAEIDFKRSSDNDRWVEYWFSHLSLPEELRRRPRGQGRQRFVDRKWPAAQYRSQIQVLI